MALSQRDLAAVLLAHGDLEAGQVLIEEALEALRQSKPAGDPAIAEAEGVFAMYLVARRRFDEAEGYLLLYDPDGPGGGLDLRSQSVASPRRALRGLGPPVRNTGGPGPLHDTMKVAICRDNYCCRQ